MKIKINSWSVIRSNLLKIITAIVIYNAMLVPILFSKYITYSSNFSQNKSAKTIGLVGIDTFVAEDNIGFRSLHAAENLGWRAYYFRYPTYMNVFSFWLFDSPITVTNFILNQIYNPEYTISVTQMARRVPFGKKFMFFSVPFEWVSGRYHFPYQDYDGYIDINQFGRDKEVFREFVKEKNKGIDKKILGFPAPVQKYKYKECKPKNLVIFGGLYGKGRDSARYLEFLKMLNDEG